MHIKNKLGISIISTVTVLFFLTVKNVVPNTVFMLIAFASALYFFPFSLLKKEFSRMNKSDKAVALASSLIISFAIMLAILSRYVDDYEGFKYILSAFALLNLCFTIYIYFKHWNRTYIIMHIVLMFLSADLYF